MANNFMRKKIPWKRKDILQKTYLICVILLLGYMLFRLVDMAQLLTSFPIDKYANDLSSHIAKLTFLKEFGYRAMIPYWYNGTYDLLKAYPPLWHLFMLPWAYLFQDQKITVFISYILLYSLGGIAFWLIGKRLKLNNLEKILAFLFFFANPTAIGYLMRLGKLPETMGWIIAIFLWATCLYYKENKINFKAIIIITILWTLLFYAHILVFIPGSLILIGLWIIKSPKEKIALGVSACITLIGSSALWFPFLKGIKDSSIPNFIPLKTILWTQKITTDTIVAIAIPLILWTITILYFYKNIQKKDILFYSPILLISILYFTHILVFIPFFNRIYPDTYSLLFILTGTTLLLTTKWQDKTKKFIAYSIIPVICIGIVISFLQTPFLEPPAKSAKDLFEIIPFIEERYLIISSYPEVPANAIYAYAATYFRKNTAGGWDVTGISNDIIEPAKEAAKATKNQQCQELKNSLAKIGVKEVIAKKEDCTFLSLCLRKEKITNNAYCLYKV